MPLGNTLNILRPPGTATQPIQTGWNEDLVKNLHKVLGEMSQQITSTTTVSTASLTSYATKALLEAATVPAIVTSIQLTGYTTDGDGGGAFYIRGSEPSHALKIQSADGAWWELIPVNGIIPFQAIGGVEGDDAANGAANVTVFDNFISYAQAFDLGDNFETAAQTLYFRLGHYHFNAHLNVKAGCNIVGESGWGAAGNAGTKLEWPVDTYGFIFHVNSTIDITTEANTKSSFGSTIRNLMLSGGGSGGTIGSGIWMRGPILVQDCLITLFAEDGVRVLASTGGGASTFGNANRWQLRNVACRNNGRHGLFVNLVDANIGLCVGGDYTLNGRWGIFDENTFGNTYIGCHAASNGMVTSEGNSAGESSLVTFGGNSRYSAHLEASEADLVATTPGTDETVWISVGTGGTSSSIPLWVASQSAGTYFHGGSYATQGSSNNGIFTGCYTEGQQAPQVTAPAMVVGGLFGSNRGTFATQLAGPNWVGRIVYSNDETHFTITTKTLDLLINRNLNELITAKAEGDSSSGLQLLNFDIATGYYIIGKHGSSNNSRPIWITTDLTSTTAGRTTALIGGKVIFPNGFWVGAGENNARFHSNGTAAPSSGEHGRGDIVWNRNAAAAGTIGWVCITAGDPGTWKTFGVIES